MEIILKNYNDINLKINHGPITGIYNCSEKLLDTLKLNNLYKGNIKINDIKIDNNNIKVFNKRIEVIEEELDNYYYLNTVKDLIYEIIKRNNIEYINTNKKIYSLLKIFNLNKEFINKNINELSTIETKLLLIILGLIKNPSMLIIKEPFKNIDMNNIKKILRIFNKLMEDYQKGIIFISNDIEMLYKYTENIIICNNKIIYGETNKLLQDVDLLKENNIKIPEIVEITYLANLNKKAKLNYHKDIRDIIKDIYKHV